MRIFLIATFLVGAALAVLTVTGTLASSGGQELPPPPPVVRDVPDSKRPSVYLLMFDELNAGLLMNKRGEIDERRFPNFAALAAKSTFYRNNSSAADNTPSAIPAIMTGHQPVSNRTDVGPEQSIYSLLYESHKIKAMEHVSRLCREPYCERQEIEPSNKAGNLTVAAPAPKSEGGLEKARLPSQQAQFQAQQLATMINSIEKSKKPQLWVAHVGLPHVPYTYLGSGDQYFNMGMRYPGMQADGNWAMDPYLVSLSEQRLLLQLQFVDRMVGQWRKRLEKSKQWDNSMVVLTADHGVSHWAGQPRRFVETYNFGDIANTPLFVKYPGQKKGHTSNRATRAIDLLPTIALATGTFRKRSFEGDLLNQAPVNRLLGARSTRRKDLVKVTAREMARQRQIAIIERERRFPYRSPIISAALGRVNPKAIVNEPVTGQLASLDNPGQFNQVKRGSGWRTATFATGYLSGVRAGSEIMITANGRPAGIGSAFLAEGQMRYAMLLAGLRPKNKIKIYVRAGDEWLLLPQLTSKEIIDSYQESSPTVR